MKLALGTAQFGLDYGISNNGGQVALDAVSKILDFASKNNITVLDTAQAYGNSEQVLGKFDLSRFKIVTKMSSESELETSLEKLGVKSVYALLFHKEIDVNDETWAKFEKYKKQGKVQKIGVSVYSPEVFKAIMSKYPIDIVQLPLNILDQRFLPLLPELKKRNIEIHTRSTFLQGLLLMDTNNVSKFFDSIKPLLAQIPEPKLDSALGFVKNINEIDSIVVGATSLKEISEIVSNYNAKMLQKDFSRFSIVDEQIILPQNWRLT